MMHFVSQGIVDLNNYLNVWDNVLTKFIINKINNVMETPNENLEFSEVA